MWHFDVYFVQFLKKRTYSSTVFKTVKNTSSDLKSFCHYIKIIKFLTLSPKSLLKFAIKKKQQLFYEVQFYDLVKKARKDRWGCIKLTKKKRKYFPKKTH